MARAKVPEVLAAVDLGSNSFHLVIARYSHGQLTILDRLREVVRLAGGLDKQQRLSDEVCARALECLRRFGQRLRDMRAAGVRVVGTDTLRRAQRKQTFLSRARAALGHPIEIISGLEEARLIYMGVANSIPDEEGRRLVIDIGGGSTEMIVGERFTPLKLESLHLGCVALSMEHFPGGRISPGRFERARLAARLELQPVQTAFRAMGWQHVWGSSGTVRVILELIRHFDRSATAITPAGLERLIRKVMRVRKVTDIDLPEITPERAPVLPGGLAILAELFATLGIERMRVAEGALREGLLHDMVGRFTDEDARVRTVRAMQQRYHVDMEQAARVEESAVGFLRQVAAAWGLEDEQCEFALRCAARLHEIGLDVSHSQYQKHGAYLLAHADMPGFPRQEQQLLACLVGAHRRKIALGMAEELMPPWDRKVRFLVLPLRLAVLAHRGRSPEPLPPVKVTARGRLVTVRFPKRWLREHPLTAADLGQEVEYWRRAGFRLRVVDGR